MDCVATQLFYGANAALHVLLNQHLFAWEMANSLGDSQAEFLEEDDRSDPNIVAKCAPIVHLRAVPLHLLSIASDIILVEL